MPATPAQCTRTSPAPLLPAITSCHQHTVCWGPKPILVQFKLDARCCCSCSQLMRARPPPCRALPSHAPLPNPHLLRPHTSPSNRLPCRLARVHCGRAWLCTTQDTHISKPPAHSHQRAWGATLPPRLRIQSSTTSPIRLCSSYVLCCTVPPLHTTPLSFEGKLACHHLCTTLHAAPSLTHRHCTVPGM